MNKLVLVAAIAGLAACQPDTKSLEKKIDDLTKSQQKMMDLLSSGKIGAGAAQQRPARAEPDRAKTYAVPVDGDPTDGPADAKITLVKAYDYACPYCEKVRDTMDELKKKYGNDIRIVYKQFVVHPQVATAGALGVCAADKQGKFIDFDRLLWDKGFKGRQFDKDVAPAAEADGKAPAGQSQHCWDTAAGCPIVLGFAKELNLDEAKFKKDMKDCNGLIQKDMKELQALGVGATPSFFINGRFLSGAMPGENFTALIDEELKKANERIQQGAPAAQYYQQWVIDKGLKTLEAPKQ